MKIIKCQFEWKLQDLWIGMFWKTARGIQATGCENWMCCDIWICVIPCVPLHVTIQNESFLYREVPE